MDLRRGCDGMMAAVGFIPRNGVVIKYSRRGATLENVGCHFIHPCISAVALRRGFLRRSPDRALKRPATISHRSAMGNVPRKWPNPSAGILPAAFFLPGFCTD